MQKNTRAGNSLISTNLKIFATICTSAFIGAFGADLWANTKYNGALEGHRSSGSTEGQSNEKIVVAYAICDIAQGTRIERRMLAQKELLVAKCPANVVGSLWDIIGKRIGNSIKKGDYICLQDVLVPYSDN